ncbi:MAG: hypothetical protein Q4D93_03105 [Porphyromonas sp.]|nr:hypothetical protein [Porphyromonas sp.]
MVGSNGSQEVFQRILDHKFRISSVERHTVVFEQEDDPLKLFQAIGERYIGHFEVDDVNIFLYQNLLRWANGDREMKALDPHSGNIVNGRLNKGIYISGATGTGKSLALKLLAIYSSILGIRISFNPDTEERRPLFWNAIRTDEIVEDFICTQSIKKYKSRKILCIDEVGGEQLEAVAMGNRLNVIQSLLEHRGDDLSSITLITSNLPITHELTRDFYGDRVVSRLQEMCNYFVLGGKDRRIIQ